MKPSPLWSPLAFWCFHVVIVGRDIPIRDKGEKHYRHSTPPAGKVYYQNNNVKGKASLIFKVNKEVRRIPNHFLVVFTLSS